MRHLRAHPRACAAGLLLACAAAAAAPVNSIAPAPQFGAYGVDTAGMDRKVQPGDDFYDYVNGTWQQHVAIPPDRSAYGMFTALYERSQRDTREVIEAAAASPHAPGSAAQKVADAFRSFMDTARADQLGLAPVQPLLAQIAAVDGRPALMVELARLLRARGMSLPVDMDISQDDKHPDRYWVQLTQGGLGLGDRDLYDSAKPQFDKQRAGYKAYLRTLFTLAGLSGPGERADAVYALEAKLAAAQWTRVQNRDPQRTYNPRVLAAWQDEAPGVDWAAWFAALGIAQPGEFGVGQPSALVATAALLKSEPLPVWKDYLRARLLDSSAPLLDKRFVDASFAFHGTVMAGVPQNQDRWKRAVAFTVGVVPDDVSQLYVAKYFPPATRAQAQALVHNLLRAMGDRIRQASWMTEATKAQALKKLASYTAKIGYPDKWKDYRTLDIRADDLYGNALRAQAWRYADQLAKLGGPIDRSEWYMTPMTVNAYYNPALNEIVFPAAILQPPFFDPHADAAVNYGAIGVVIGHEITHGFDDEGRQYDGRGALHDWWTPEDAKRFDAAAERLVKQYDGYCPYAGECVNGKLTLGENIADLGGLNVAYDAYHLSLHGKPAPVIDGVTGDQRFFEGFAQVWRSAVRDADARNRLATDPHSPDRYRVDTLRNFAPWYAAFSVKPGQKLYLPPDQRVSIW